MIREWFYEALTSSEDLAELVGTRIMLGETFNKAPETKPFIIYRFGNTSPDNDVPSARRQYATVYVHDEASPGEYLKIDEGLALVIGALTTYPPGTEHGIVSCRWLESSSDQDDREMSTILRYARFQIITADWYS